MPKINFTQDELDGYLKEKKEARRFYYDKAVEIAEKMKVHADGMFPKKLLEERRPNEPLEVKVYREKIWVPITKPTFSKVFSSLQKIRRSEDWSIRFEGLDEFTKIADEENLEQYTEVDFPYFSSITNWVFTLLLRKYLIDPNAVVIVMPLEFDVPENEFIRPFPVIFDSIDVIDYRENDYAVLNNPLGAIYMAPNNVKVKGRSYFIITTKDILRYDQIDGRNNFDLTLQYPHGLEMFPGFTVKGIIIDQTDNQFLYEQRIAGMLPELEEAVREYSDLQAAKVLHIYPERWEFTNNECQNCKGTGRRPNVNWTQGCDLPDTVDCLSCHGRGYTVAGPYSKIMIKPPNSLEPGTQIPNPPAGYVQKDVEIIKIQESGVEKHIYNALASQNFEFLAKTPLAESGISKEVDKDELNNNVHSIAEDKVSSMDSLYRIIAYYRYKGLYSFDDIELMLPTIPVPEKFDILSPQHLGEELGKAKTNKFNPAITNSLEIEFAGKKFNADQSIRNKVQLILELDPLPNISEDDKMTRLSNKGVSLETYVISSNIQEFVQRALDEDPEFADKPLKEQKKTMLKFAKEQTEAITAEKQAMMEDMNMGGLGELQENGQETDPNQPPNKRPVANAPV